MLTSVLKRLPRVALQLAAAHSVKHLGPALSRAGAGLALHTATTARPAAVVSGTLALSGAAVGVGRVAGEAAAASLEATESEEGL
jgi:hypothetical protein